ncbi:MAG: urease accessory protein UreF [Paracoccaceae bacterium]
MTTGTAMRIEAADSAALLTLAQWLSPAFPVSGFAYSHGLEAAIAAGDVTDAAGLEAWVGDLLALGSGRADAILLCAALRGEDADTLAATARALAASAERLEETEALGSAFAATLAALGMDVPAAPYPVAVGVAARTLGLPAEVVAAQYLQAFAATLIGAAVRFMPLGQSAGQGVLTRLRPVVLAVAAEAAEAGPEDIATCVPGADIAAMRHETMDVRIFRT